MSEHFFGLGPGHLSPRARRVAEEHGATLVNHTDPGCQCGRGCVNDCPRNRRHWFAVENLGFPHDDAKAREVLLALEAVGVVVD